MIAMVERIASETRSNGSGRLKPGWTRVAFGDVVRRGSERSSNPELAGVDRYVGLEHLDPGELAIRRWGDVGGGTTFTSIFRPGHVLFGKRRAYLRKVAVPDFSGVCSGDIYVLESRDKDYLLRDCCRLSARRMRSSSTPSAHRQALCRLGPTGRISQRTSSPCRRWTNRRRIANVLSAATETGETYARLEHAITRADLSAIQAGLDRNEHRPAVPVVDLLREPPRNGIFASSWYSDDPADYVGLKTGERLCPVDRSRFEPAKGLKRVEIDAGTARPFLVQHGDAFIVRGNGNRALCGQAGLAHATYDDLVYPDKLIRLRFDPTRIIPEFAVAQWNLPRVHQKIIARGQVNKRYLDDQRQDVRAHRLVVPPLSDQRRSVLVITRMQTLRDVELRRRTESLARLRNILLNSWATSGK